ncbi:MAG TPA: YciI family protein [Candidatus Didemnitutus sp.]|nr:YciI family protein [Candidatus Didemnitutus sp.]
MNPPNNKLQYLLLLRQPPGPRPPPEFLEPVMVKFAEWMKSLQAKKIVVATNGLETTGKVLRGPGGKSISDGPYPEAKEIVGGYVLISVDTEAEAIAAAQGCPGLNYAMVVELRPVAH